MTRKEKIKKIIYDIFIKYQLLFIILIVLDQITKLVAIKYMQDEIPLIGNWLSFKLIENNGVAFGRLQGLPQWFHAAISIVATLGIEYYIIFKKPDDKVFTILLLVLAAGALGNGIDRWAAVFGRTFMVDGRAESGVVDFINVSWFANFNVADIYVTLSCIALVLYMFLAKDDSEPTLRELNEAKKKLANSENQELENFENKEKENEQKQ